MLCCKRPDHSYIPTKSPGLSKSWKKVSPPTDLPTSHQLNSLPGSRLRSTLCVPISNVSALHSSLNGTYVQIRNNRVLTPPSVSRIESNNYEEISNSDTFLPLGPTSFASSEPIDTLTQLNSFATTNFWSDSGSSPTDSLTNSYVNIGSTTKKRKPKPLPRTARRRLNFDSCQETSSATTIRSYTSVETQTLEEYRTNESYLVNFETRLSSIQLQIEQLRDTVQSSLTISSVPIEPLFSF